MAHAVPSRYALPEELAGPQAIHRSLSSRGKKVGLHSDLWGVLGNLESSEQCKLVVRITLLSRYSEAQSQRIAATRRPLRAVVLAS